MEPIKKKQKVGNKEKFGPLGWAITALLILMVIDKIGIINVQSMGSAITGKAVTHTPQVKQVSPPSDEEVPSQQQEVRITKQELIAKGYDIRPTEDGGYLIMHESDAESPQEDHLFIIKLNEAGEEIWRRSFHGWEEYAQIEGSGEMRMGRKE